MIDLVAVKSGFNDTIVLPVAKLPRYSPPIATLGHSRCS